MDALLNNIMGDAMVSVTDRPSSPSEEPTLTVQPKEETKEVPWRHFSFICSVELVEKVQAIAHKEGFSIRALMEFMISQGVTAYEAKYGKVRKLKRKRVHDVM